MKYRKKPVVIEAIKCAELVAVARNNWIALPEWFREQYEAGNIVVRSDGIDIQTLEGTMTANLPDVVIRGVQGELYPCKPDIFEKTYEPVEEP